MRILLPRRGLALLGMLAAVVNAAGRVALVPLFVAPVFDRVLSMRDLGAWPELLLVGASVALLGALALFAQDALLGRAAANVSAAWRAQLYQDLLGRRPGQLPGTSGGLSSRIVSDLKDVESYYQYGLGTLVAETVTLLGIFAVLLAYNAPATLMLLGMALPLVLILWWLGRHLKRVTGHAQAGTEAVGAHLQEGLRHHAVVRAFAALPFMARRFGAANEATRRASVHRSALVALQIPAAQVLIFAAIAVLVAALANSAAQGRMSSGQVVAYLVLVLLLATPAQLLPGSYAFLQQARSAKARLAALLSAGTEVRPDTSASGPRPGSGLALENLSFAYTADAPVLAGVTLELPPYGLIALIGSSGSGKTTLLQLLLRFLEPSSGSISLAGQALDDLSEAELRRLVGYVPQSTDLLRGSLRDNLALGRPYPDDALWRSLASAGLEDSVRALPGGLDYELREDGAGLSGGQRQRLAVARALLSEPALLLLDEPSAALDEASEALLVETLRREAERRLVLVVAHRPALIDAATRVLALENGRLREEALKA